MTAAFNLAQLANNLNTSGQLDATDGLAGLVANANLASSGTASSSTYLRGDRTWATLSQNVLSIANVESGASVTGTSTFASTGAIPQITSGTQLLQLNITPQSSSSYLWFLAELYIDEPSNSGDNGCAALFKTGVSNAYAVWYQNLTAYSAGTNWDGIFGQALIANNSTSAQTWTVRIGNNAGSISSLANTTYINNGAYGSLVKNRLFCMELIV